MISHHHVPRNASADEWQAFVHAAHQMTNVSCCGGGAAGAELLAGKAADLPILLKIGHAAWRASIKPSRPKLPTERNPFVLPDVTLLEPAKAPVGPVDLVVAGGRIAAICAPGTAPSGVRVIEALRGHFVAPGLTDMHIHMPPANILRLTPLFMLLNLRFGVVRARDAGDPDGSSTPAALALVESGSLPGPDIRYAYAFVGDGAARWGNTLRFARPEDARSIVARLAFAGATWIKAYENLDAGRIAALCQAADEVGLKVMGHVPTLLGMEEARLPDAQHGFGVPCPRALRRDHVLNRAIDWESVDALRRERVIEACLNDGLAMTPTLVTTRGLIRLGAWETERCASDVRLLPGFYTDIIWHPRHGLPVYRDIAAEDFARARDAEGRKLALVGEAVKAGVDVRLGTDTQQPFIVPGIALHDEMSLFEQAGVPREHVWRMAGPDAAAKLGIGDATGLAIGQRADLVVSAASPFATDWSPELITATVCAGACVLASDLDSAIARELRRFENRFTGHLVRWLARFALEKNARNFAS